MGKTATANPCPTAAPPAQQDQWRQLSPIMLTLNQREVPRELGGEGSSLCGVLLPAWDAQVLLSSPLILEDVVKRSVALMPVD